MELCSIAPANDTQNRYYAAMRKMTSATWDSHMAALTCEPCHPPESKPDRSALLRVLDTLAEWQMRHSHNVIRRVQADNATISGVTHPSGANERSSTKP
jgi:hypothetical protein